MRKICLILAMVLMLSMPCAYAHAPGTALGMELLSMLPGDGENRFVSPVSLACALSLAAQGAEGETKQEILKALEIESPEEMAEVMRILMDTGLKSANAVFVRPDIPVEEKYADSIDSLFNAAIFEMDDNAAAKINAWASDNTDGLIDKLLQEPMDSSMAMCLLNAICMDAKWRIPFDEYCTRTDIFHAPDGDEEAQFMNNEFYADYAMIDDTQIVRLEYRDSGLSMLLALPPKGGIETALDAIRMQGLDYFAFNGEKTKIDLKLPKLDISVGGSVADALKTLGMETMFSENADFSGISSTPLIASDVIQKVRVQVDEEGTRAAAATAVVLMEAAMIMEEKIVPVHFDRPFIMLIADEATGCICFAGVVTNPAA